MSIPSDIIIPLNREGVLRVHIIPDAELAGIRVIQASWDRLPELILELAGEARGLPDGTPVTVTAAVKGDSQNASQTTATLRVDGYQPGALTRSPCRLQARIDLAACRALGKQVKLVIALSPAHPTCRPLVLADYEADLECTLDLQGLEGAVIGSAITILPGVASLLASASARVIMQEVDRPRTNDDDDDDDDDATLALADGVPEKPTPAGQPWTSIAWTSAALTSQETRVWHVGCTGESTTLEYPQPDEVDGFEFEFRLELSFDDGAHYVPAAFTPPGRGAARWSVIKGVPRPRLRTFTLSRSLAEQIEVAVQIDGFSPGFEVGVIIDLWLLGKNPAGANVSRTLASCPLTLVGGAVQASLTDGGKLRKGSSMYATLRLAESPVKKTQPASHWLEFDKPFKPGKKDSVQSATFKL